MVESVDKTIRYQGRKTSRPGSEQRRRAILEASLRIIIDEGIRAIRHRAVAKEADVPLSATTYYFKDIKDLIADTFTLFAESQLGDLVDPFWDNIRETLKTYNFQNEDLTASEREGMIAALAELAANFVLHQLNNHRSRLLAEQAFLQEAIRDERLRELAQRFQDRLLDGVRRICEIVGTRNPDLDSQILTALIARLEYEGLLVGPGEYDRERIIAALVYQLDLVAPSAR